MASTAALELLIALDAKNASQGLDDLAEKGGGLGDAVKGGLAIAGGALLGFGGILVGATKQAADNQLEMSMLGNQLKNVAKDFDGNLGPVEDYIGNMQNLAFTDTELRSSLGQLAAATGSLTEAQDLQATAMDLARLPGMDLEKATKLLTKADNESYAALGKLGIQIDSHATKEEALQQIRAATAGQAETYANSAVGSMTRLQNSVGEAFESVGSAILPLVTGPLQALADWFSSPDVQSGITNIATGIGTFLSGAFTTLQTVIAAVMPYIQPFIDAVQTFLGTIAGGGDIMGAFGQYFSDLGAAIGNAWTVVGPALGTLLGSIVQFIIDNGPTILATLAGWAVNFGMWIWNDALPALMTALGGLITAVWGWIVENGPTILATLAEWTGAFFNWVWNDAIPALLGALGGLIQAVWTFIQDNGSTILATLGEWTTAFFNWVMNDVLPQVPGWLANIATALWTFITTNAPVFLQTLGQWTGALMNWIMTDVLPQLPGWLWNIASALWTFISTNAPILLTKLGEWTGEFLSWVMNDVLPQVPTWLGNIAGALWTWITETAKSLGDKLFNEWIPAFWNWLTGPNGVLVNAATMLNDIWIKFTTWIGTTASNILTEVGTIGGNIVQGIKDGINGAWTAFVTWVQGLLSDMLSGILDFFGIHSPSTVMRDQVGIPLIDGMKAGVALAWDPFITDMDLKMGQLVTKIVTPIQKLCDADGPVATAIRTLCDDDILDPIRKLCDEDMAAATSGASLPGITNASANAKNQFLSDLDYMKSEYDKLQGYLQNGVSVGGVTTYNGNGSSGGGSSWINTGNNAANGGTGGGGGRQLATGGVVTGLTRAWLGDGNEPEMVLPLSKAKSMGFGGGNTINLTINAGIGADARSISEAAIEAIEYALGDRIAIRRGGRP